MRKKRLMAAVNGAESMAVPSADKYFIRNTSRADAEGKSRRSAFAA